MGVQPLVRESGKLVNCGYGIRLGKVRFWEMLYFLNLLRHVYLYNYFLILYILSTFPNLSEQPRLRKVRYKHILRLFSLSELEDAIFFYLTCSDLGEVFLPILFFCQWGVNFINMKLMNFSYKCHFGSFYYVHV